MTGAGERCGDRGRLMAYFDYDEKGASGGGNERITVLEGLSEDEWQMITRNAQNITFSDGDILHKDS